MDERDEPSRFTGRLILLHPSNIFRGVEAETQSQRVGDRHHVGETGGWVSSREDPLNRGAGNAAALRQRPESKAKLLPPSIQALKYLGFHCHQTPHFSTDKAICPVNRIFWNIVCPRIKIIYDISLAGKFASFVCIFRVERPEWA